MTEIQIPKAIQAQIDAENARVQTRVEAAESFHPEVVSAAVEVAKPSTTTDTTTAAQESTMATAATVPAKESFIQKVEADAKKVWTVIEKIGKDAEKGLTVVATYLPKVEKIAAIFFPSAVAELTSVQSAIQLALNTIAEIKQKSSLLPSGLSSEEMIDEELQIAGPAVLALLKQEGVPDADTAYVQKLITTLVGILQSSTTTTTTTATS